MFRGEPVGVNAKGTGRETLLAPIKMNRRAGLVGRRAPEIVSLDPLPVTTFNAPLAQVRWIAGVAPDDVDLVR